MSATAPIETAAAGDTGERRRQFLPPARLYFDEEIPEEELLISWQRDPFTETSGVSLVELRDARLWVDIASMCVHDAERGVNDELSLFHGEFDYERAVRTPIDRIEGTVALLPHLDPHNFYHWLIDTVPCFGVLGLAGIELDRIDRFYIHRMDSGFQRRTLERLGVDPSRIISFDGEEHHYEFERLLVPLFRLDGAFWPNPWAMSYLKGLYLDGAARAANDADAASGATRKLVYVRRGDARRAVTNEAALEERLVGMGFTVLAPETHSFEEQARALADADAVLGSHGAGLANIAFCRPGTRVMEFGGHYITTHFRIVAQLASLRYRSIAAGVDERGERLATSYEGEVRNLDFECDVDAVADAARAWFEL